MTNTRTAARRSAAPLSDGEVKHLAQLWATLDLKGDIPALLHQALGRLDDIRAQLKGYRAGPSTDHRSQARAIAAGELTLDDAIAAKANTDHHRLASTLADQARSTVLYTVTAALRDRADQIVDDLNETAYRLHAAAHKAANSIGAAATPEQAFAFGGKVTTAWHALNDLHLLEGRLDELHRLLWSNDIIDQLWMWDHEHPDALVGLAPGHPVRRYADTVLSAAGPRHAVRLPDPVPPPPGRVWPYVPGIGTNPQGAA